MSVILLVAACCLAPFLGIVFLAKRFKGGEKEALPEPKEVIEGQLKSGGREDED